MAAQVIVNGPGSHMVFRLLKEHTGGADISWNFNKFLVVKGLPVKRYPSKVSPLRIEEDILQYLKTAPAAVEEEVLEDDYDYEYDYDVAREGL